MTVLVPPALPAEPRTAYRSTVWTAMSQLITMVLGASMALVVLLRFGKSSQTDAVFAAYAVYGVLLMLCLSFRITIAPRLAEGPSPFAQFDHFLGAGAVLVLFSGLVLIGLGDWVAGLLIGRLGPEAQATTRWSLGVLWIAVTAQFAGALGASALGVRGDFGSPGLAYTMGGLGSLVCLVALPAAVGVLGLPLGIAAGSVLTAVVILCRMLGFGYRPSLRTIRRGIVESRSVGLLLIASLSPVAWQLNYLISLGFAARLGTGAVTLYSYSFSAAAIVTGVTASAGSLVLVGRLAQRWDRHAASLEPYLLSMLRVGLLITLPALACAAWTGEEVITAVLGRSLGPADAHAIALTFLALAGMLFATVAIQVPMLAAFASSRYATVALLLLITSGLHFGLTTLASFTGEVAALGLSTSISTIIALVLVIGLVYGRLTLRTLAKLGREVATVTAVCAAAFGPAVVVGGILGDGLWDIPLAGAGVVLFGFFTRSFLPDHYALVKAVASEVLVLPTMTGRKAADECASD